MRRLSRCWSLETGGDTCRVIPRVRRFQASFERPDRRQTGADSNGDQPVVVSLAAGETFGRGGWPARRPLPRSRQVRKTPAIRRVIPSPARSITATSITLPIDGFEEL